MGGAEASPSIRVQTEQMTAGVSAETEDTEVPGNPLQTTVTDSEVPASLSVSRTPREPGDPSLDEAGVKGKG